MLFLLVYFVLFNVSWNIVTKMHNMFKCYNCNYFSAIYLLLFYFSVIFYFEDL